MRLRISPVPRRRSRGTCNPGPAIAVRTINPLTIQSQKPIRDAVKGKASRYGKLDLPYVIAVNAMGDYAKEESVIDALFGTPGVRATQASSGQCEQREIRSPDGVWHNGTKPTHTRVSAVLSTERLKSWSLGQRRARLVLNPWAQMPLPDLPFGIDTWRADSAALRKSDGASLADIFGLPDGWPE